MDFMAQNYRPGYTYQDFAHQFTAEFYDPDKWVQIFKAAGAKYVVLTSKHHEGYTLWPSKTSWNWNAMDIGPKRDLAKAVRKEGLKFGAYHSWMEFFNPLFLVDQNSSFKSQEFIKAKTRPELEELINEYKPELIWSDGDWMANDTYWNSTDFLAWLYNESPVKDTVVVNDRWGKDTACKHGGYYTCTDRYDPGVLQPFKWENAMSLDRSSWGFRRDAQLDDYITTKELITQLVQTVSCGGNLLINIGPTADGRINLLFEERLRQFGSWLEMNGEAIYSSKPWKHQNDTITRDVWYTSKGKDVYSISLKWPLNNELQLGALDSKIVDKIELLGVSDPLTFKAKNNGTVVVFPVLTPDTNLQFAYVLKIKTKIMDPCHDFYDYVCGKFGTRADIPDDMISFGVLESSIGGWPLVPNTGFNDQTYDRFEALSLVIANFALSSIIEVGVQPDIRNNTKNILYLGSAPDLSLEWKRRRSRRNHTRLVVPIVPNMLDKSMESESMDELKLIHIRFNYDDNCIVTDVQYFRELPQILLKTPNRVIANFLGFSVVQALSDYTIEAFRELDFELQKSLTGITKPPEYWKLCVELVDGLMSFAISRKYIEHNFNLRTKRKVNGENTKGENTADNGGLRTAFKAYKMCNQYKEEPKRLPQVSQYTPDQLFFISYATLWCDNIRPEALESVFQTDEHSPPKARVNALCYCLEFGSSRQRKPNPAKESTTRSPLN
ncbi:unnamed protein product [Oppiella nova]|uniref:Putative alpha-L-fucosidase n=1 Tax=Oppiella nova TaxID=334625 RepID=A0A7R9LQ85_9ACAR|nr:unnamed protein product [Oppiella nova]CAG2165902.1 unnamed protein product [Oppiella nova]